MQKKAQRETHGSKFKKKPLRHYAGYGRIIEVN